MSLLAPSTAQVEASDNFGVMHALEGKGKGKGDNDPNDDKGKGKGDNAPKGGKVARAVARM